MKLIAAYLVRNEADIWEASLRNSLRLYDEVVVCDHMSVDGTWTITQRLLEEAGERLHVLRLPNRGYYQVAVSNELVRKGVALGGDWISVLDADEFPNVRDRAELERRLSTAVTGVAFFTWRNLYPSTLGSFEKFDLEQEYLTTVEPAAHGKVTVSGDWVRRFPQFRMTLGNHAVLPWIGARPNSGALVGEMLHIPVRSKQRLLRKVEFGTVAMRALGQDREGGGEHWTKLLEEMGDKTSTNELRRNILAYGRQVDGALHHADGPTEPISLPHVPSLKYLSDILSETETVANETQLNWREARLHPDWTRATIEGTEMLLSPEPRTAKGGTSEGRYRPLPTNNLATEELTDERLAAAVDALSIPIETRVPSAWTGHAPTMLALFELLRPRRFVELGSHYGMSFYAACQGAQRIANNCECVAIDTWKGDHQAGFYSQTVLSEFRRVLEGRYSEIGSFIRSDFQSASELFDNGSIDFLHIDGLHEYEAVKADFETWLPKMSERGVVAFHDTIVRDEGYGVWQLWDEVKKEYPSWNAPHTHGLGILFVGHQPRGLADFLHILSDNPAANRAACILVENAGKLVSAERSDAENTFSEQALPSGLFVTFARRLPEPLKRPLRALRAASRSMLTGQRN